MFNKLLEDTYTKVRSTADEVRHTVLSQASKAKEVLGLGSRYPSASALLKRLDTDIATATSVSQLNTMYTEWTTQMMAGVEASALYDDDLLLVPRPPLFTSPTGAGESFEEFPGDITSQTSWIPPVAASTDAAGVAPQDAPPPSTSESEADKTAAAEARRATTADGLTFRQVVLRSQVLETALLRLARLESVRKRFVSPDDTEAGVSAPLHRLLGLTLAGDGRLHRDLLFLMCTVDLKSEVWDVQLYHLAELIALLKHDWLLDALTCRKQRLIEHIQLLEDNLKHLGPSTVSAPHREGGAASSLTTSDEDAATRMLVQRSTISRRVVELMLQHAVTVERIQHRRRLVDTCRTRRLEHLQHSLHTLCEGFATLQVQAADRGSAASKELASATQDIDTQRAGAEEVSTSLAAKMNDLVEERRVLLKQLDDINGQLTALGHEKRQADAIMKALQDEGRARTHKLQREASRAIELQRRCQLQQRDMENVHVFVSQAEKALTLDDTRDAQHDTSPSEGASSRRSSERRRSTLLTTETTLNAAVQHLENELQRLQVQQQTLQSSLRVTEELMEVQEQKQAVCAALKEEFESEHRTYTELVAAAAQQSRSTVAAHRTPDDYIEIEGKFRAVNERSRQYRGAAEAVSSATARLSQMRRHVMEQIRANDLIWEDVQQVIDLLSSHDVLEEPPTQPSETEAEEHHHIQRKLRDIMEAATEVYTTTKQILGTSAHILGLVSVPHKHQRRPSPPDATKATDSLLLLQHTTSGTSSSPEST